MNAPKTSPEPAPGHYGAGYGEQVPAGVTPQPAPQTDDATGTGPVPPATSGNARMRAPDATRVAPEDDGAPVVFTPDDVAARPPDHPPTENAPESEKAGLIFERS